MKLGIVVVYLVEDDNEPLLDLHLRQIDKHTEVPYTIYGCVNRLAPRFKNKLECNPHVRICPCPDTDLRGSEEHSFYLARLIEHALDDGVSHIAVFHVDSFPIRPWVRRSVKPLSDHCLLVAIMRDEQMDQKPLTAFMFFHRDFYKNHCPRFLLTEAERFSRDYKRYRRVFPHHPDSGVGFGFTLFQQGLTWHALIRSRKDENHKEIGGIYGECIFHLNAATQRGYTLIPSVGLAGTVRQAREWGKRRFSPAVKQRLKRWLPTKVLYHDALKLAEAYELARARLFTDPDSYFHDLLAGNRPRGAA